MDTNVHIEVIGQWHQRYINNALTFGFQDKASELLTEYQNI